jgi:hypothetical protein
MVETAKNSENCKEKVKVVVCAAYGGLSSKSWMCTTVGLW